MLENRKFILFIFCATLLLLVQVRLHAQNDSVSYQRFDTLRYKRVDSFLSHQKGLIGQVAQNLFTDTTKPEITIGLQRIDERFQPYRNRIIRKIIIRRIDFGVPINDTSISFKNKLTNLADWFHHNTRENVIRKNLFFSSNQPLMPFLLADNEKHLRDLDFLQDAKISVVPVRGRKDSVDVLVLVKDVLSISGSFEMHHIDKSIIKIKEDNLAGMGDKITFSMLYDQSRLRKFGWGGEYIARNIAGSFIDGYAGLINFTNAFNSYRDEETTSYLRFIKPLVNPYMRWTYAAEVALHTAKNMYVPDSLFQHDFQYKYYNIDAWAAWNMSADDIGGKNEDNRLRRLISARYLNQQFQQVPLKYADQYYYEYADVSGLLWALSFFKQNFYKTQYVYGFGRNEDVPEGLDVSFTGGLTKKFQWKRPYGGLKFQRYFFTAKENYCNITIGAGTYWYHKKVQDANLLFNIDYFSRLHTLNPKWKQRNFIGFGIAKQVNEVLNEPLFLESSYGIPEFRNGRNIGGNLRATVKAESVFFSPWTLFLFRFAPFAFGNLSWINTPENVFNNRRLYSILGAGVRTRNESLVFGTVELRGYYFPGKNYYNQNWRVEIATNIKFKYNQQLIKRPEFVQVN